MNERPANGPWEEDYGPEEELLHAHGFHRIHGLEDIWQEGSVGNKVKEPKVYTRQEALERIAERMDKND